MSWSNILLSCRTAFVFSCRERYFYILNTFWTQLKHSVSLSLILPKLKLAASFLPAQTLKQAESGSFLSDLHRCRLSPQSGFPSALWRFGFESNPFFKYCGFNEPPFLSFSVLFAWRYLPDILQIKYSLNHSLLYGIFFSASQLHPLPMVRCFCQPGLPQSKWKMMRDLKFHLVREVTGRKGSKRKEFPAKPGLITLTGRWKLSKQR